MSNPYFAFRQFTVYQDRCAMKVGTDGVLLGAWTDATGVKRILDVGTGTGLIALMLAQRTEAVIDAVEIDEKAAEQALQNVKASPWPDRIRIFCAAFQLFTADVTTAYDLVVSNPPYYQQSLKPPDKSKSLARHDDGLSYQDLLHHVERLLSSDGRLSVILPSDVAEVFADRAYLNGLYPLRMTKVRTTASSLPSRLMAEFSRERQVNPQVSLLTVMEEPSPSYTDEYKALTADYYL